MISPNCQGSQWHSPKEDRGKCRFLSPLGRTQEGKTTSMKRSFCPKNCQSGHARSRKGWRERVKEHKQVKKAEVPFRPAVWVGACSTSRAHFFYSSHLSLKDHSGSLSQIAVRISIYTHNKGKSYIQVRRGCQGKERECEGWTWGDKPMKSNTPPQPSRSPGIAEETSYNASNGTKVKGLKDKT